MSKAKETLKTRWKLSALLALFATVGRSYRLTNSGQLIFSSNVGEILKSVLFFVAIFGCIVLGSFLFERLIFHKIQLPVLSFIYKKSFLILFSVLLVLADSLWILAFFPGNLEPDALYQLMQGLDVVPLSTHYPVASTLLFTVFIKIGLIIFGSAGAGLFLYVCFQFIYQNFVFIYVINSFVKHKYNSIFILLTAVFYLAFPLFPIWGICMVKDTLYYVSFLLVLAVCMDIFSVAKSKEDISGKDGLKLWTLFLLAMGMLGMLLTRNEGKFVVIVFLLAGLFTYGQRKLSLKETFHDKSKVSFAGVAVFSLLIYFGINAFFSMKYDLVKGSPAEALSIPIQQTARYIREYSDIKADEKAVLEDIYGKYSGGNIELLGEVYNEDISDPVKTLFTDNPSKKQIAEYLKVWAQMGLRHPGVYIDAFINHIYGYYDPFKEYYYPKEQGFGKAEGIGWMRIVFVDEMAETWLSLKHFEATKGLRDSLTNAVVFMSEMPIIRLFYHTGAYTWLLFLGISLGVKRKDRSSLLILSPMCLVVLICMASPVGAHIRYMLPIISSLPFLLGACLGIFGENNK